VNSQVEEVERPTILFAQYANPDYYPLTYNLARLLASHGYEVSLCCRADRPTNLADYGEHVEVHRIGKPRTGLLGPLEFALFLLACFRIALRVRPSLLIGYDLHGLIAVGLIGRVLRKPFFYHLYDLFVPEEGIGALAGILKRFERTLSCKADALIISSESKAEYFLRESKLQRNVLVVANAPPLQQRVPSDLLKARLRERGFEARYVVYYHGSIGPGKGHVPVIRSIPYWPEGAAFVLLGIIYDPSFYTQMMREAEALGVQDRVHYFGVVPFTELYPYTRSADVGLFVPETEATIHLYSGTAVVKLNDYMACGVPFVVSRIDALCALASGTGAGCTVDVTNPRAMGETIGGLLRDDARRKQMGDAGYQLHRSKLNLAAQYAPVMEIIQNICGPGKTSVHQPS
jgi:glycosyltransferase involved in cell wall biosynthesis